MFDKFGEMNSYTEINELAANLLQEGDLDSLKELAKENGIPDDYVEMYLEEAIPSLCDSTSAAIGKIDVECMKLKPKELMLDWVEYIKGLCMENEMIAHQVRKKGKGRGRNGHGIGRRFRKGEPGGEKARAQELRGRRYGRVRRGRRRREGQRATNGTVLSGGLRATADHLSGKGCRSTNVMRGPSGRPVGEV